MPDTPAFLDSGRPAVPDLVVPRGVTPFHLPQRPVRGRLVRLGPLAEALLTRHDNPEPVRRLTGEALALVAGLAGALKYRGSFSLQAKGDGPVSLLLADCTEAGALRGYARADAARLASVLEATPTPSAAALLGAGYLALTVDQGPETERYQGIVALTGRLARRPWRCTTSRPASSSAASSASPPPATPAGWRAAALILEHVAGAGGVDPALDATARAESWHTATTLAATVTDAELLDDDLPPARLLWRLFAAEGVAVARARALAYGCRCSRQRLAGILEGFGTADLDHMSGRWRHRHDLRVLQHGFSLRPRRAAGPAGGRFALIFAAPPRLTGRRRRLSLRPIALRQHFCREELPTPCLLLPRAVPSWSPPWPAASPPAWKRRRRNPSPR